MVLLEGVRSFRCYAAALRCTCCIWFIFNSWPETSTPTRADRTPARRGWLGLARAYGCGQLVQQFHRQVGGQNGAVFVLFDLKRRGELAHPLGLRRMGEGCRACDTP